MPSLLLVAVATALAMAVAVALATATAVAVASAEPLEPCPANRAQHNCRERQNECKPQAKYAFSEHLKGICPSELMPKQHMWLSSLHNVRTPGLMSLQTHACRLLQLKDT